MANIKQINNHWTAMKMIMTNLQEGGETVIEISDIEYDIELEDNIFSTNNLKKH